MGVNSLPKTVTRERRGCDLSPGSSARESSTLTTRLPSDPVEKASYRTGVSEAERPETQVGCGVRDTVETVLDRVNRLMDQRLGKVELHQHDNTEW